MANKKINFDEPKIEPSSIDKLEQYYLNAILKRFEEMKMDRNIYDKNWPLYQKMIDAIFQQYADGRSSSTVPLATALIELGVAEELAMPLNYKFKSAEEDQAQQETFQEVWDGLWRTNNYAWEELKSAYDCWGMGTSVDFMHFERTIQEQQNPLLSSTFDLEWQSQFLVKNEIKLERFDYRRFWPDNRVTNFDLATDCIAIQVISIDAFRALKSNPVYKNIDKVAPQSYYDGDVNTYSQEEKGKQGKFVQLIHYYDITRDCYIVVANKKTIVRMHPIMTYNRGEKALPFAMRQLGYKENSKWGRGICELAMNFNSQINNFNEMLMDGVRRSNLEILAIGSGLKFKNNQISYGNKLIEFEGDINRMKQITGTPPSQALFNGLDRLYTDIAVYTGLDVRNIIGDTTPTKFQAELQRESSMKRVKVWLKNRDMSAERKSNIMTDLIQRYYWMDKPRRLVDTMDGYAPESPMIEIEGKEYDSKKKTFKPLRSGGKSQLLVTKDMLEAELYVDVYTNDSASSSRAIQKANTLDFMKSLPELVNAYSMAQQGGLDLQSIMPAQETLEELAENFDITIKPKEIDKNLQNSAEEVKNKLKALGGSLGANTMQEAPTGFAGAMANMMAGQPAQVLGEAMPGNGPSPVPPVVPRNM